MLHSPDRRARRLLTASLLSILAAFALQAGAAWHIERLRSDWPAISEEFRLETTRRLGRQIDDITRHAGAVAAEASNVVQSTSDTTAWFRGLQALYDSSRVDALMVFGPVGELVAWAGEHKAPLPEIVRVGKGSAVFVEQALNSYLYRSQPLPDGKGYAAAAVLLSRTVHGEDHEQTKSAIADTMAHIAATIGLSREPAGSWPLRVGRDTVAHLVVPAPSLIVVSEKIMRMTRAIALSSLVLAGLFLVAAIRRMSIPTPRRVALVAAVCAMLVLGMGMVLPAAAYSSFLGYPLAPGVTLGLLAALTLAAAMVAASLPIRDESPAHPVAYGFAAAVGFAILYPAVLGFFFGTGIGPGVEIDRVATVELANGGWPLWLGVQFTAFLLLAVPTVASLALFTPPTAANPVKQKRRARLFGSAAVITSLAVSLLLVRGARTDPDAHVAVAAAFVIPIALGFVASRAFRGSRAGLYRWLLGGWIAGSAVLSVCLVAYVDAKRDRADMELESLGPKPDPYLEYLMLRFAKDARGRSEAGASGTLLLYRSWLASGLASISYPVRLTLWSNSGVAQVQLAVGGSEAAQMVRSITVPTYLQETFERTRVERDAVQLLRNTEQRSSVRVALLTALDDNLILSAEIPPRRSFESGWLPFVSAGPPIGGPRLHLIFTTHQSDNTAWAPVEGAWRKEAIIPYPDGDYRAHVDVPLASTGVMLARGALLIGLDVVLLICIWAMSRLLSGTGAAWLYAFWRNWRGSVRARTTLALFTFFLVPTVIFGLVAFRALSNEVVRSAEVVATQAARQAAKEFQHSGPNLRRIGAVTGSNVLYYAEGEISRASLPEVKELGVYGAWIPAPIYSAMRGQKGSPVALSRVAGVRVVTSYISVPGDATLAVPLSMNSAEIRVRQLEMAHLILFGVMVGAALSLLLAFRAGRALTKPIAQLQRSAARIGAGDLSVRLPEEKPGEFAALFHSFNQMTRRLRRARAQQVRSARVLAWGEMARQVAHEIKNPLTPIKLSIQHLRRSYRDGRPDFPAILDENIGQILTEIDRLASIAGAFSRYGAPAASNDTLQSVDLRAIAAEALTLYRQADAEVRYAINIGVDIPLVRARHDEFMEVLFNLLENARYALIDGVGTITLAARRWADQVEFIVADNGSGISAESLPHIFDPQFSTRTSGTGLGLAIVKRLVESWGGTIHAASEPGKGTQIIISVRAIAEDENN